MIKMINGNILEAKVDIIAYQVNCQGVFDSDTALAIKEYDQDVFKHYSWWCEMHDPIVLLGTTKFQSAPDGRIYAHMFTKLYCDEKNNQNTCIEALTKCLKEIKSFCKFTGYKVALPYKSDCVSKDVDREEVYRVIENVFSDYEVELWCSE